MVYTGNIARRFIIFSRDIADECKLNSMSESQGLLNCCQPSDSEVKVMRSCESKIVMRQLTQQQSLGSEDLKVK